MLTVHAAKGLEFDRVFIADAVNGRFPQEARPTTLLSVDDRQWLSQHGVNGPFIQAAAESEEASLWYVAVTRAKQRLTIVFSQEALAGSAQAPSRFIPSDRIPQDVTVIDREPLLLRALRSGDARLRERLIERGALANAPILAAYAEFGNAAFAPVATRPLRRERPLSVGNVEKWLRCPRQIFYERFANLQQQGSTAMDLGSMLHKTLERFHEIHTDFTAVAPGAAETWIAELRTLRAENWDATQYDTPLVAQAAAQRADVALSGYARSLEAYARRRPFRVEKREMQVTVQVGPGSLSGKVDRIDVDPAGGRTVVDYKSGNARADSLAKAMSRVLDDWDAADAQESPRPRIAGKASNDLKVQLALYATAVDGAAAVAYVYLAGAKEIPNRNGAAIDLTPLDANTQRFTTGLLDELRRDVLDPLAESRLLTLPVTEDIEVCRFCAYKNICPGPEAAA